MCRLVTKHVCFLFCDSDVDEPSSSLSRIQQHHSRQHWRRTNTADCLEEWEDAVHSMQAPEAAHDALLDYVVRWRQPKSMSHHSLNVNIVLPVYALQTTTQLLGRPWISQGSSNHHHQPWTTTHLGSRHLIIRTHATPTTIPTHAGLRDHLP
jgi:hypothetical protein